MVCVVSATCRRHVGMSVVLGGKNPRHDADITSQVFESVLEEIARAYPDTRIRPSLTLVLTGPSGRIGGFLGVTAFF